MPKIFLILVSLVCGHTAQAEDIYLGQWSKHFKDKEYNEEHIYIGYQKNDWIAAYFKNSFYRNSLLLGRKTIRKKVFLGEIGVRVGLVSGYDRLPVFALGYYSIPLVEINFIPGSMVSIGFKFKMR